MSGHDLHLPLEICTQILSKLPVKSVVRFRCVCKTWYSLVSCPNFISDHTAQTLNRSSGDRALVHHHDTRNRLSNFSFHDESFVESHEHPDVPEWLRSHSDKIVGSCDGLICFSKLDTTFGVELRRFMIWNPSIRKLVEIPHLPSTFPLFSGFGFDPESRDYKVVRIEYHESSHDYQIHIFDLRKGVWRSSSYPMSRSCLVGQPAVYLHGNLHCPGTDHTSPNYILASFNLSGEVLHETEMVLDGDCLRRHPRLLLINGLLSVTTMKKRTGYAPPYNCSVWSMKEYGVAESWAKLFTIDLPHTSNFRIALRVWENGEVLFLHMAHDGHVLVLYNPECRKSVVLPSTNGVGIDACFYKESLVLP